MMIASSKVLAIIPARAGSKGLPGKNHRLIAGRPLIQWTIDAAAKSRFIDKIIVTTDDDQISKIANFNNLHVIDRPPPLATDMALTSDVILHSIEGFPDFEIILYLQPTSPCRQTKDIDTAITLLAESVTQGVVSVVKANERPDLMFRRDTRGGLHRLMDTEELPRQEIEDAFLVNGAIYCAYRSALLQKKGSFIQLDLIGMVMPPELSIDIDTEADFKAAEEIIDSRG